MGNKGGTNADEASNFFWAAGMDVALKNLECEKSSWKDFFLSQYSKFKGKLEEMTERKKRDRETIEIFSEIP